MEERSHILGRAAGVELPADYRKFLDKYEGGAKLTDGAMRFSLATAEVLAAPFPFDNPRMDRPLFEAHFVYLGRMRDAGVLVFEGSAPVSPDRYAKMVTIGFGERPDALEHGLPPTHVVVLDPADGSVRLVPIDPPAVVRRVADSFGKWFRKVKVKQSKAPAKGKKTAAQAGAKTRVAKKAPAKKPAKTTVLATLKKQQRLTLPAPYEKFLKSKTAKHVVETADGRSWQLGTSEDLAETSYSLTETAAAKPVPFVRCTRSFAELLKAADPALKGVPIVGEKKKKFTLARLKKGVCVGASNGDPLFLDPSTRHTVWTYSQDQKTVAKVAESFSAFIKPRRTRKPTKKAVELKAAA